MTKQYIMHGWQLSYFSGKLRGYLNFKGLMYKDKNVNAFDLMYRIPKHTGARVMPAVQTPNGEWLQDTTIIMEELDKRHPDTSAMPSTPKQLIASMLLEAWFDEWWIPIGMHYRWSYPENYDLFIHDASTALLPYCPNFIRQPLAKKLAGGLQDFLPLVGVRNTQFEAIESSTHKLLDALENHFSQHAFLLGNKPSIADFALLGPMYGHLNRDPAPKRDLLDVRPNLQRWIQRCHAGEGKNGSYLANDEIPLSLTPIFESIFEEFFPMVDSIKEQLTAYLKKGDKKSGDHIARIVGQAHSTMNGHPFSRGALPYTLWMMQRIQKRFQQLSDDDKGSVNQWTGLFNPEELNREELNQVPIMQKNLGPALKRTNVVTRLA